MKTSLGNWLSVIAIAGMALPVQAGEISTPTVTDVALSNSGSLSGAVVNNAGKPLVNSPIQIMHKKAVVARAKTDAAGRYSVQGLRSGLHVVRTVNSQRACRFWTASTAPPAAKRGLVLTSSSIIVRGQCCDDGCGEGCGEDCRGGGCGLFGGALLPMAAFAAVSAVTVAASTRGDKNQPVSTSPPSSP